MDQKDKKNENKIENIDIIDSDDNYFFAASERPSADLQIEPKRLSAQDSKASYQALSASGNFPDSDFYKFKRKKAEYFIFDLFVKSYFDKQISSFYLIWDNIQYDKIDKFQNVIVKRIDNHKRNLFKILKNKVKKKIKFKKKKFILRSKLVNKNSMNSRFGLNRENNKFKFSSFESKYKSFKKPSQYLQNVNTMQRRRINLKNKITSNLEYNQNFSENQNLSNRKEKIENIKFEKKKIFKSYEQSANEKNFFKKRIKTQSVKPKNQMRRLREVLEREEIQKINSKKSIKSFDTNFKKSTSVTFNKVNRFKKNNSSMIGKNSNKNNYFKKFSSRSLNKKKIKSKFKNTKLSKFHSSNKKLLNKSKDNDHQLNPAIARIFFLLSKRFQDSKYTTFFMDQIEILVFKHGIKDKKIMGILDNLDLRFDLKDLCPGESELEESENKLKTVDHQKYLQRQLEKKYTKENIQNLEDMMMIFRADQLFAPLYRSFSKKLMFYRRNFFVNLRYYSKLTPFRKLHCSVQNMVKKRTRKSFSQILFYIKPNLRLLLMIYVISKVKQRNVVDAYRRIYGFYNATIINDSKINKKNKLQSFKDRFNIKPVVEENKDLMEGFMEHIQSNKDIQNFKEEKNVNIFHESDENNINRQFELNSDLMKKKNKINNNKNELTKRISNNVIDTNKLQTRLRGIKDNHFDYYDSSLDNSKRKQSNEYENPLKIMSKIIKKKQFSEDKSNIKF